MRMIKSSLLTAMRFGAAAGRHGARRRDRMRAPQRWGVASQVREPLELLMPFVLHHLAIGASEIVLYFDDPDDPAADVLAAIDGVTAVRCDRAHWARVAGKRPAFTNARQFHNIRHAFANTKLNWIAHIDADEYLLAPGGFDDVFASFGRSRALWVQVLPLERIWEETVDRSSLFSGVFRSPLPGREAEVDEIYGAGRADLYPAGMGGHAQGKPLVPVRAELEPGIHGVKFRDPVFAGLCWRPPSLAPPGLRLLHFPAMTAQHFALKQLIKALHILNGRVLGSDTRSRRAVDILDAPDPMRRFHDWFEQTYVVERRVSDTLSRRGLLDRSPRRIDEALRPDPRMAGLAMTHDALDDKLGGEVEKLLTEVRRLR